VHLVQRRPSRVEPATSEAVQLLVDGCSSLRVFERLPEADSSRTLDEESEAKFVFAPYCVVVSAHQDILTADVAGALGAPALHEKQ
jgi:hypothetical protein